jgi:hypothetical protein
VKRWAALAIVFSTTFAHADADDELARARFLDQQGVRAFAEGRYRDAMTLFNESYRAGGPATELWNVARCQLKLDDPDGARRTLEAYLEQKNLPPEDRAEGKRLYDDIEKHNSTFVVASTPAGATVTLDGHAVGLTPYTSSLTPGAHEIVVAREGVGSTTKHVVARDGRAVVISVALGAIERPEHEHEPKPKHAPKTHVRRFSAELGVVGSVSVLGGGAVVTGAASPEVAFGFAPFVFRDVTVGIGVRFRATYDQWSTTGSVSNATTSCTPPNDFNAVEMLVMPTVFASFRVSKSVRIGGRIGFGGAIYAAGSPIAGDLFTPACIYGGSLAPDGYAAFDVSIALAEQLRLVVYPVTFDVHPAYVGARSDGSIDASGPWVRLGAGLSLAVDL